MIIEEPLYGSVTCEVAPNSGTTTWTDVSAYLTSVDAFRGGVATAGGISQTDVGTMSVSLGNWGGSVSVGDWVRLRTAEGNVFAGYVADWQKNIVFINNEPNTVTVLFCNDWVGYIAQYNVDYAEGYGVSTYPYPISKRLDYLKRVVDSSGSTPIFTTDVSTTNLLGHTSNAGTIAEHLDLVTNSAFLLGQAWWASTLATPSNATTGRSGLIKVSTNGYTSTGLSFTDGTVTGAGFQHYTEINIQQSSQNIANNFIIENLAQLPANSTAQDYDETYMKQKSWTAKDSTSITAYGSKSVYIPTNLGYDYNAANLIGNPSVEHSLDGWTAANTSNYKLIWRAPSYGTQHGTYAGKLRVTASGGALNPRVRCDSPSDFNGGETIVEAGQAYSVRAYVSRSNGHTNTQARIELDWMDDDDEIISSTTGSFVTVSSIDTWYAATRLNAVAPTGAVRGRVTVSFERSSGAFFDQGSSLYVDQVQMGKGTTLTDYFDGNFTDTTTYLYNWLDGEDASTSVRSTNKLDELATAFASYNSDTYLSPTYIRWNAQEDLTKVASLDLNKTVNVYYDNLKYTQRITGIEHSVSGDRWMVTLHLQGAQGVIP